MSAQEVLQKTTTSFIFFLGLASLLLVTVGFSQESECPYENLCHGVVCQRGYICKRNKTACTYRCSSFYCPSNNVCPEPKCDFDHLNPCKDEGHACVSDCNGCVVSCVVQRINHTFPKNPQFLEQDFRKIKFRWNEIENFNASGDIKHGRYTFFYQILAPRTAYFRSGRGYLTEEEPILTLDNLPVNTIVRVKVALEERSTSPHFEYSLEEEFKTKPTAEVRRPKLPEKVTDIEVQQQYIEWKTPENIIQSNNELDKSIQYNIDQCNYNPLLKVTSQCKTIATVVGNSSSIKQSTLQTQNSIFPVSINIPTSRDIAVKITPVALNLDKGPAETKITRLDPLSVPKTPFGIQVVETGLTNITLSWDIHDATDQSVTYLAEYTPEEATTNKSNAIIVGKNGTTLTNLTSGTSYNIRIAVSESRNGSSLFSDPIIAQTNSIVAQEMMNDTDITTNFTNSTATATGPTFSFFIMLNVALPYFL